jgi:DNA-binding TFAR19-related protein (PDSD5 family)
MVMKMKSTSDDKEMEMLLRRKMINYLKYYMKKREEKSREPSEKQDIYQKIKVFLEKDAYEYLIYLKDNKKGVADTILKYLIYMLINGLVAPPIDKHSIEYLERRIEGRTGQIYIKRRGELKAFDEFLRED